MLDFYLINDEQQTPKYPKEVELKFVGSLDDSTFYNLLKKEVVDKRYDYYSDFRWSIGEIKSMLQKILNEQMLNNDDVRKLTQLLDVADRQQSGLIAYGD